MSYVMLPAYIESGLNNELVRWLGALPEGSWQCNSKVGQPAKFEFIDSELATLFKLKFGYRIKEIHLD